MLQDPDGVFFGGGVVITKMLISEIFLFCFSTYMSLFLILKVEGNQLLDSSISLLKYLVADFLHIF